MRKRQRTKEDSLAEAFPEATPQQQFMLCLKDQLSILEQRLETASFIPKHLVASGCSVAKTFIIRCHVLQKEESRSFAERLLGNIACETAKVTICRHHSGEEKSMLEAFVEMPHSMTSLSIGQIVHVANEQPGSKLEVHGLELTDNDLFLSDEILRCQHTDKETPCHYVWQESKLHCEHVPVPAMTTDLVNLDFCLRHPASITARVADVMQHMNS